MKQFTNRQIEIMEAATARIDMHGIQNLTIKNLAADLGVSEPALYRHFDGKNEILLGVLRYFIDRMELRLQELLQASYNCDAEQLRAIFMSQLTTFTARPAIVSFMFAESIFQFDDRLNAAVLDIMTIVRSYVEKNIKHGQQTGEYSSFLGAEAITTIITGAMRMAVLTWKLSGRKSNLIRNGTVVLDGIITMISHNH